jgi:hypothetical protein
MVVVLSLPDLYDFAVSILHKTPFVPAEPTEQANLASLPSHATKLHFSLLS